MVQNDGTLKFILGDCKHKCLKLVDRVWLTKKAGPLPFCYCPSCEESFLDAEGKEKIEAKSTGVSKDDPSYLAPIQGEFCLINSNVEAYLNTSTEAEQIAALRNATPHNVQTQKILGYFAFRAKPNDLAGNG